jgi:hypothetical protein
MATQIFRDGVEYTTTTVQLPKALHERAKKAKIPFHDAMIRGIESELQLKGNNE